MKIGGLLFSIVVGAVTATSAVSLIDTDFTTPYINGDLAGQQGWETMPLTGTPAFEVDSAVGSIDTEPCTVGFGAGAGTNGHYVFLSPADAVGNAVDDEWSGSMDFKLSTSALAGTNVAVFGSAHEVFDIGFTAVSTNGLNVADPDDILIRIRKKFNGTTQVTLDKSGNYQTLAQLTDEQMGWDPAWINADNPAPVFETDDLRLTWTLRKSRVEGTYLAVAVLSNLVSGAVSVYDDVENDNFVVKTNIYTASSLTLAMGHNKDAADDGTKSLVHIEIDSLSLEQSSGNAPELIAPVLAAGSASGQVVLSWDEVIEAESYTIKRGSTPGSYVQIATTTDTAYTDTNVQNDSVYYYIVTASATGSADVDSNEVEAEPQEAKSGTIVDTDFIMSEGYADADLGGQERWKRQANAGATSLLVSDSAGQGFAGSTLSTFDTDLGNGVYHNTLMSNNVMTEWSGSMTFTLSTAPTPGQSVSEGGNSYDITGMTFGDLYHIGLVQPRNVDNELNLSIGTDDVGIKLRLAGGDGNLGFRLNDSLDMLVLDNLEMGWDPDWTDRLNANGPDFVTDEIMLDWRIRKSTFGTYLAVVDATVGGVTYNGTWKETTTPSEMYGSEICMFGMTHDGDADKGKDLDGNAYVISPVLVSVNSMSVVASNHVAPLSMEAPVVKAITANREVALHWEPLWDAVGYSVYRHDALTGGTSTQLASGLTDTVYSDTDVVNETTYWYSVVADYGSHGTVESSPRTEAVPSTVVSILKWGPGNATAANVGFNVSSSIEGTVLTDVGAGEYRELLPAYPGFGSALYGVLQRDGGAWAGTQLKDNADADYLKTRTKDGGVGSILIYSIGSDFSTGALDLTTQTTSFEFAMNVNGSSDNFAADGAARIAIRNGTQWYASASNLGSGDYGQTLTVSNLNEELWMPLTEADPGATALMTVIGQTPSTVSGLTNITAIGYFGDHFTSLYIDYIMVRSDIGSALGTPLEQWAADFGLIGDERASDADPDMDGLSNLEELGLGGNPNDSGDTGTLPKVNGQDAAGTVVFYLYPGKVNEPKPSYTVLERAGLTSGGWEDNSAGYAVSSGAAVDGTDGEYIWMTNAVPVDLNEKFIGLQISE